MGTTAEKLQAALDSKNAVQTALEDHGVEVTDDFSTYGALITSELTNRATVYAHVNNKNNPHGVTAAQVGAVPTTRKVNSKALSADITLSASDVGAAPTSHASTATTYGAGSGTNYGHVKLSDDVASTSAASAGIAATPKAVKSAYDLANTANTAANTANTNLTSHAGNKSNPHGVTAAQVGAVPTTRTVNGKALSANITLGASDVSAAPTSHASTATTYGIGTGSNYGHVKLSDSTSSTSAATAGIAASPAAVKSAYDLANTANTTAGTAKTTADTATTNLSSHTSNKSNPHGVTAAQVGAAPTSHASTGTTYGAGTDANYGHVKLSDATNSTSAATAGIAASPKAVKTAYDLANTANTTANTATTNLSSHTSNTSNPHGVTAAQVGAAPTSHASTGTTYGAGTGSNYGHVKLSDSTSSTSSTSGGIAATPAAVKSAYDLANTANTTASAVEAKQKTAHIVDGLSSLTLSETDFNANMQTIFNHFTGIHGGNTWVYRYPTPTSSALVKSVLAKLKTDLALDISSYLDIEIKKFSTHILRVFVYPQYDSLDQYIFYCVYRLDDNESSSFVILNHPSGHVPTTRKVNNKALSADITLSASDVSAAPTSHASTATTYGAGTGSNYGHVKLSDSTSSTSAASAGIAASPKAVKAAYDLANTATTNLSSHTSNKSNPHGVTAAQVGALPLSGGTLTANGVYFSNGYGRFFSNDELSQMEHYTTQKDDNNRSVMYVSHKADLASAAVFRRVSNGTSTDYPLYGEHNKPTASDVGAVPTTRTVNGKALSANISLGASDVSAAPTSHASTATTYGAGTGSNYGHVKLSDSTSSTSSTSGGIAATPKAVKSAYDLANTANTTANTAKTTADTATTNLSSHTSNKSNPHGVTAAQVGALPISGGTITGADIFLGNGLGKVYSNASMSQLVHFGTASTDANRLVFAIAHGEAIKTDKGMAAFLRLYNNSSSKTDYKIFGQHNKPTGTYSGSGSATSKTVSTGGIGSVLVISSTKGAAIVTKYGTFCKAASGSTITGLAATACKFDSGVLTLASANEYVNASGITYTYQVV